MENQIQRIVTLYLGSVVPPESHPDRRDSIPIQAFAIDTCGGIVLVDTGLGEPELTIDSLYRPTRRSLAAALSENGLSRQRIIAIVSSHLHFDHAGALRDFPAIPIHVQRDEMEAARQPRYTTRSRIEVRTLRYVEHQGDTEIAEGVRLIATPGHTPGHQSVVVETDARLVILACQAAYVLEEWTDSSFEHPAGAASAWDRNHYRASLEQLRSMNPSEVRFTHDRRIWRSA